MKDRNSRIASSPKPARGNPKAFSSVRTAHSRQTQAQASAARATGLAQPTATANPASATGWVMTEA